MRVAANFWTDRLSLLGVFVLAGVIAVSSTDATASDPDITPISEQDYSSLLKWANNGQNLLRVEEADVLRIINAETHETWLFTKYAHPAYPSAVKNRRQEVGEEISITSMGWKGGDEDAFKAWWHSVQRQNERTRIYFKRYSAWLKQRQAR